MLAREWRQIKGTRPCSVAIFPNDNFAHPHDCYTIIFLNMSFTKTENIINPNGTTIEVYESTEHLMFPLDNPNYEGYKKFCSSRMILYQKKSGLVKMRMHHGNSSLMNTSDKRNRTQKKKKKLPCPLEHNMHDKNKFCTRLPVPRLTRPIQHVSIISLPDRP
ncbi:hypothetical protein TorRG33x02_223100 [Trema orientale]|uniref:Uncharacterized protein n=1 Tax=Trema orientale TaxID=63057 RepID=A0A2P5E8L8_TREOI|nr:hypothetical protein TorRG33x02_223100 [Trema orientale]